MNIFISRFFPFLNWPRINRKSFSADLIAGITVALVAVPQSLAYAQLAGVPAYYGLYAAFIPSIIGVLFGSSGILSTGPVAMTSLLTAASVSTLAVQGSEQFTLYVTLLALLSGLFQIAFGLARAGALMNLMSHPVLMGFINAAALIIALSQLPALTGISVGQSGHFLLDTWHVLLQISSINQMSFAFGIAAIVLMYGFKRFAPRLPGVLIVVALLTWFSTVLNFAEHGGKVVGTIPTGLPSFFMPPLEWKAIVDLLPAAFVIAVISFMEAMSSCKVIALRTRTRWDENQELVGQGLAKVAAAFCQSMPVSGSFSRSALNLASNAQTGMSSLITAAFVLLTLLFFTPYLFHLPKPVLAAMIILAVVNLIDVAAIRNAWRASNDDGIAAVMTFGATLVFAPNIQNGILTGIIISLCLFIYRRMVPRIVVVGLHADGSLRDAERWNLPPLHPQIGSLRIDASLFFANASFFEDAVLELQVDRPDLKYILIAASGMNYLDATGVETLRRMAMRLRDRGITLVVSSAKSQVLEVMERTGLVEAIGADNIFISDNEAISALNKRVSG